MTTYTTAQIEEREPSRNDGCFECGNDEWVERKGEYRCNICGAPYADPFYDETLED